MHWTTLLLALSSSLLPAQAKSPLLSHQQRVAGLFQERFSGEEFFEYESPSSANPQFLTNKTKKFAVNGKGLPDVPFDFGESYAGLLPMDSTDKELFFWFVPSTNPAAKNEITIWLNGGPGCSSLDGFLHENGPFIWQAGTYLPVRNTYSWNNLTNIVYIEQPVGTGFTRGTPNATNEIDVADQFNAFWKNFMQLFELEHRKVYITGESYAGQYVPYIADGMIKKKDTTYYNLNGIIVFDPSIGNEIITELVPAVAFTDANANDFPFNDTFKEYIHEVNTKCGYEQYLNDGLVFPPKGPLPPAPKYTRECDTFDMILSAINKINPCYDIYQVGQLCPLLWDVLGFPYSNFYLPTGYKNPYFNRTDVKTAIHAPIDVDWSICANGVFPRGDHSPPSGAPGGPLGRVAEHTNNVIVGHGAIDMVLILNGTLLTLQNLTWNGAQGLSEVPSKPFYVPYHHDPHKNSWAGAGVFGSWQTDRGLTFVSIDLSGHEVPEYQPSAGYRILEKLLGRIKTLQDRSAFSTQPGYPQPKGPLGKGNGPFGKRGIRFISEEAVEGEM